ncbi:MAG: UDP-N-acetylmuramate--L-alanine ligase [Armatimonadota bacterium]
MQHTLDSSRRYHFVAIGGIGMSAIAQVLLARGFRVSGSDRQASLMLERLRGLGAEVWVGHDAEHVRDGDVVVLSDAIKPDNPEWRRAAELNLPIVKRADMMGTLANSGRGVAVAGTHGKTTTSGMLALILTEAGMDPTCLLGGELAPLGGNARAGGPLTLVEACEAYESFHSLFPEAAIVTNIEVDHLDHHGTPEHLYESFRQFLRQVKSFAVLNGDDPLLREMAAIPPRAVCYGVGQGNDYRFADVTTGMEPSFTLLARGKELGRCALHVPGVHNISNATGAAALALELGADFASVQRALAAFPGMHRRFERVGKVRGVMLVDDYAHHPTEIRATLAAARAAFSGKIVAVFQPHLYSRTRDMMDDFVEALKLADIVLIAPIYAAREAPIPGVSHEQLVARLGDRIAYALGEPDAAVEILAQALGGAADAPFTIPLLEAGDIILTMGAGDIDSVAHALIGRMN